MDVPAVHPSRGTVGTAHGADAVRSNEWLDDNTVQPRQEWLAEAIRATEYPPKVYGHDRGPAALDEELVAVAGQSKTLSSIRKADDKIAKRLWREYF